MFLLTQQGLRIDQILDNIVDLQENCPEIQAARIMMRGETVCWRNRDSSDRIYAPYSIRRFLIQFYHEEYTHPSSQKTLSVVQQYFDWPGSKNEVENYVFNCLTCKMNKYKNSTLQGEFQSVTADRALQLISVDLFGPLPVGQHSWEYIVVCMDVFTKFTRLYPSVESTTHYCLIQVQKFVDEYKNLSKVDTILTDNGTQFISSGWVDHWEGQDIRTRLTSLYHPQANPVETRMKVIGDCLRILCPTEHWKWSLHLKTIERRLNETPH